MKIKIDASIVCFACVIIAAIPVTILRTKTYAIGYELAKLKEKERAQRQRSNELQSLLAAAQHSVRDRYLSQTGSSDFKKLSLPETEAVFRAGENKQAKQERKTTE